MTKTAVLLGLLLLVLTLGPGNTLPSYALSAAIPLVQAATVVDVQESVVVTDAPQVIPVVVINVPEQILVSDTLPDSDFDGIVDNVDTQLVFFSNGFSDVSDVSLRGMTTGTIVNRADQILSIQDATAPDGLLITASAAGGATPATISMCGGMWMLFPSAGDTLISTCSSVTIKVISGPVEATFGVDNQLTVSTDTTAKITEVSTGVFAVENQSDQSGGTVTLVS